MHSSKHYLLLLFLSSFLHLTCVTLILAQEASFQGLGDLPGGNTSSRAYGVSPDGFAVVGESCTGPNSTDVEPFLWLDSLRINSHTVLPQRLINLGILPWCTSGGAYDVSDSGKAVCGYSHYSDKYYPFYWTDSTGMMDMDTSGKDTRAYSGSADGKIAVGTWHHYFTVPYSWWFPEACIWIYPSTSMGLGYLDVFFHTSEARAISSDGSTVVGWSNIGEVLSEAFYWTESTGMVGIGTEYISGIPVSTGGLGVSPNGDWIVGVATVYGYDYSAGFAWSDSTGIIYLEPIPPSTTTKANAVSDKGLIIAGCEGYQNWGDGVDALIWMKTDSWYQKFYVKDYLEINCGLDLTGWDLREATDISDDGRVIVGYGKNPSGVTEAWRAVLPLIEITKPQKNELFKPLAESYYDPLDRFPHPPDTIKWLTHGVDHVNILFSADSGKTYSDTLVKNYPCPEEIGSFVWWVPDTLSRECMIKIYDAEQSEPINIAQSEVFRIKGYELTRVKDDLTYEAFDRAKNGWQFINDNPPLWTPNFHVDYSMATDPNTQIPYNTYYAGQFSHFASPDIFPSWPIFVGAFGQSQCYLEIHNFAFAPSPTAFELWSSIRKKWRGSCFGMSVSASLAFTRCSELSAAFPGFPSVDYIGKLSPDPEPTFINMINVLQTRQYDYFHFEEYVPQKRLEETVTVLENIRKMLLDSLETSNHCIIGYFNLQDSTGSRISGGHAVLPYKMDVDFTDPNIVYIRTYDPNSPLGETDFIIFRNSNFWYYTSSPQGQGEDSLVLEQPSQVYLQYAQLSPFNVLTKNAFASTEDREQNNLLHIYSPTNGNICIKNSQGDSIGFMGNMHFNTMPEAHPLISMTGTKSQPTGYQVPAGSYDMVLNSMTDSIGYASVFHDNIIYSYQRGDALAAQTDYLQYTNGISIGTHDPENKVVNLRSILSDDGSEKVYNISNLQLEEDDHFSIYMNPDARLSIVNEGVDKSYKLNILNYSQDAINGFERQEIVIETMSTHLVQPLWDSLSVSPLKILIDQDNDGIVDDSIFVENEYTHIKHDKHVVLPEKFYVSQNYPNPFNQKTVIQYALPVTCQVDLSIYNLLGQNMAKLVSEKQPAGTYKMEWDASGFASGIYFYRLETDKGFVQTQKLILLK
jgi:probable HAF family extracellular repeat protein